MNKLYAIIAGVVCGLQVFGVVASEPKVTIDKLEEMELTAQAVPEINDEVSLDAPETWAKGEAIGNAYARSIAETSGKWVVFQDLALSYGASTLMSWVLNRNRLPGIVACLVSKCSLIGAGIVVADIVSTKLTSKSIDIKSSIENGYHKRLLSNFMTPASQAIKSSGIYSYTQNLLNRIGHYLVPRR